MADLRGPAAPAGGGGGRRGAYKLNIGGGRGEGESFPSPRVSDVGGLSLFLPSNCEPDEDAINAWAGALKAMGLTGASIPPPLMGDLSVYSSDEFRMYEFKVRRCMRGRSHDWTDCPFAHPGEKARRRDPRKYNYSGTACPDFRKGTCRKGDACEYSHGVFECWLHPARYRTQPCKDGQNCTRRVCFFAHTKEQLRLLPSAVAAAAQQLTEESSFPDAVEKKPNKLSPTSTLMAEASPLGSPPASPQQDSPIHHPQRRNSFSSSIGPGMMCSHFVPPPFMHQHSLPSPNSSSPGMPPWGSPLRPGGPSGFVGSDLSGGFHPTVDFLDYPVHPELLERAYASPESSSSLNRDMTWPGNPAPQLRPPFFSSLDPGMEPAYASSPLGQSHAFTHTSPGHASLSRDERMTELMDSLQALDLRAREHGPQDEMSANNHFNGAMGPPLPPVRRSFESQWSWKRKEEERLRRIAILANVENAEESHNFFHHDRSPDVCFQSWPVMEEQSEAHSLQYSSAQGLSTDSPFGRSVSEIGAETDFTHG